MQRKIKDLTKVLEKFHRDHVVRKMLMAYRKQLKRKMKSDSKFLKTILECSANVVDLMTLQACLSQKEKKKLSAVVAACVFGKQKLKYRTKKHLITSVSIPCTFINFY